jgi:riboflavin kinase / FMN adenylyltransferase
MRIVHDIDELPAGLRFVLAIGVFDGVHRGHWRVIRALTDASADLDAQPVVLTFVPHPALVLRGSAPPLLCDLDERIAQLARLGVGTTVVQRFDHDFADQPPEAFLARVCAGRQLVGLVMTAESAFGRDRTGGLPASRALATRFGYRVIEVPRLASEGKTLSSTRVRGLLAVGRLHEVNRLLGRRYAVIGEVVHGDRRGREFGYPTANLHFDTPVALPEDGIYAVRVSWGGDDPLVPRYRADGVASLGVRPTFADGGARILEAHLFDFDGDLYGQRLRVEFVRRLRGEKRFSSVDALIRQMDRDSSRAREVLRLTGNRPTAA